MAARVIWLFWNGSSARGMRKTPTVMAVATATLPIRPRVLRRVRGMATASVATAAILRLLPQQPLGPDQQHQQQEPEHRELCAPGDALRDQLGPDVLGHADEQASNEGTGEAGHAAQHGPGERR